MVEYGMLIKDVEMCFLTEGHIQDREKAGLGRPVAKNMALYGKPVRHAQIGFYHRFINYKSK